jgi:beta-glucosidase
VKVRLRCFEAAGADMGSITGAFVMATSGSLALRLSDVRLESASEDEATCP